MNLNSAVNAIGKYLGFNKKEISLFAEYVDQAPYAAKRKDGGNWPTGTGSEDEKRLLYALTKVLKPALAVDLGTRWGAMALQMATALEEIGQGVLHTVDISFNIGNTKHNTGKFCEECSNVSIFFRSAIEYLQDQKAKIDLVFEDTDHCYDTTYDIYNDLYRRGNEKAVYISHDVSPDRFDGEILGAIEDVGFNPLVIITEDSSCGISICRLQKPTTKKAKVSHGAIEHKPTKEERAAQKEPIPSDEWIAQMKEKAESIPHDAELEAING